MDWAAEAGQELARAGGLQGMSGGGQGALFRLSSLNFQCQVRLRSPRRLPAGPASLEPGGPVEGHCRYLHKM